MKKILALFLLIPVLSFAQPCADEDTVRANAASLITATTVRINGTTAHFAGGVLSMQLRYVRVGQTDTATASAVGTTALRNLTGLQSGTQYVYYYKSVCGSGTRSQTIGVYFFTTLSATVVYAAERSTVFPYVKADTGLTIPRLDTGNLYRAQDIGGNIRFRPADSLPYYYNGQRWKYLAVDSAGIIGILNRKVDSVTVAGDSLWYWINGTSYGYVLPYTAPAISALTAATVGNSIDNADYTQEWNWNTLANAIGLNLVSTSTAATLNTQRLLNVSLTGANASASQTTYSATINNLHSGTTPTNIALRAYAQNGTTNISALFDRGKVGIGTVGTETGALEMYGGTSGTLTIKPPDAVTSYTWKYPSTGGTNNYLLYTDGTGITNWVNPSSIVTSTPTLQQVTTAGSSTDLGIQFLINTDAFVPASGISITSPKNDTLNIVTTDGRVAGLSLNSLTANRDYILPDASGTIVLGSGTLNFIPKWTPNGTTLGNSSITDDGTNIATASSLTINSNKLTFNPPAGASEIMRISNPTSFSGNTPYQTYIYDVANGDGTYNQPVVSGFNQYGTYNPAVKGIYHSTEPKYLTNYMEDHLEVYLPPSARWPSGETSRLSSATFVAGDTLGNSSNSWDFRGNSFAIKTLKSHQYASIAGDSTGVWQGQFYGSTGISGVKLHGVAGIAETNITAVPVNQNLLFNSYNNIYFDGGNTATKLGWTKSTNTLAKVNVNGTLVKSRSAGTDSIMFEYTVGTGDYKAGIIANYGSGEIQHFAQSGGYFQTFWHSNAQAFRTITGGIAGGSSADEDLTIQGTNHATKTTSYVNIQPSGGLVGIGTTTPTAKLHLPASTTTASTASLKIVEGSRQTTPEDGTINYVANNLEFVETSTVYTLAKTLTNTATLDFGSTAAGASTDLTITVTGAADGDAVSIGVPNGSTVANGVFTAWVSASNTVTIRYTNTNLVTALDPASGTFRAAVIKY